jgi:hypothetical protein
MASLADTVRDLVDDRLMPLGRGIPDRALKGRLDALSPRTLFAPAVVKDTDFASACLAALWLLHDFLDEAHAIAQDIDTAEGSWWHAIMHRREGDYWNSKYWLRRVGRHPAFATLNDRLIGRGLPVWDPFVFVDQCERAARGGGELEEICRETQREEWHVLFEYCAEHAV